MAPIGVFASATGPSGAYGREHATPAPAPTWQLLCRAREVPTGQRAARVSLRQRPDHRCVGKVGMGLRRGVGLQPWTADPGVFPSQFSYYFETG